MLIWPPKLRSSRIKPLGLTVEGLKKVVRADSKQRFSLVVEQRDGTRLDHTAVEENGNEEGHWLIKANQGHSIKVRLCAMLTC
jgi:2'-phosphotransferase